MSIEKQAKRHMDTNDLWGAITMLAINIDAVNSRLEAVEIAVVALQSKPKK